jgi:uncharacterized membrane protein
MAKKSYEQRLGLLWFWLVFYAIDIVISFTFLALVDPFANYFYVPLTFVVIITVLGELVVFVLITHRSKYTKWVVLGVSILAWGTSMVETVNDTITLFNLLGDQSDLLKVLVEDILISFLLTTVQNLVPVLYFFKSKRAKTVMIQEFHHSDTTQGDQYFRPLAFSFWRNIVIYFMTFSVAGHTFEWIYCTALRIIDPAPFNPDSGVFTSFILRPFFVYGIGAVACVLLLYPLKMLIAKHVRSNVAAFAVSFVLNSVVCTSIELVMGLIHNQPDARGKLPLCDYSRLPFNFMGQICLQNAIAFGVVSTVFVWVIYPFFEYIFARIGPQQMVWLGPVIFGVLLIVLILYGFDKPDLTSLIEDSTKSSANAITESTRLI